MTRRQERTRSEALEAYCLEKGCDWETSVGSSRVIRKKANQHAAGTGHTVATTYDKTVLTRFPLSTKGGEDE